MFDKKVSGRIRYNTVYGEGDLKKILEEEKEAVLKHFEANRREMVDCVSNQGIESKREWNQ